MASIDESEKVLPSEDENFDITSDNVVAEEPVMEVETTSEPDDDASVPVLVDKTTPDTVVEPTKEVSAPEPSNSEPIEVATPKPDVTPAPVKPKVVKPQSGFKWLRLGVEAALVVAIVLLAVVLANVTADKHNLTKQLASAKANPQNLVQQQTNNLIAQVSTLMQLPTGETPTVAQVSDATAAKKQSAFFKNAQNGDKVLLYVKAGEAILYRPSTNKIVLVAPLTFSNSTPGTTAK